MQKSTSHSVVPWGQFQQGSVSIPRVPGVRERTGYWDQRREEVSRIRGGESCVERAPGQNCDPQSKEATNRTGKTDPQALLPPPPETCHSAPVAIGPDQWGNTG